MPCAVPVVPLPFVAVVSRRAVPELASPAVAPFAVPVTPPGAAVIGEGMLLGTTGICGMTGAVGVATGGAFGATTGGGPPAPTGPAPSAGVISRAVPATIRIPDWKWRAWFCPRLRI